MDRFLSIQRASSPRIECGRAALPQTPSFQPFFPSILVQKDCHSGIIVRPVPSCSVPCDSLRESTAVEPDYPPLRRTFFMLTHQNIRCPCDLPSPADSGRSLRRHAAAASQALTRRSATWLTRRVVGLYEARRHADAGISRTFCRHPPEAEAPAALLLKRLPREVFSTIRSALVCSTGLCTGSVAVESPRPQGVWSRGPRPIELARCFCRSPSPTATGRGWLAWVQDLFRDGACGRSHFSFAGCSLDNMENEKDSVIC